MQGSGNFEISRSHDVFVGSARAHHNIETTIYITCFIFDEGFGPEFTFFSLNISPLTFWIVVFFLGDICVYIYIYNSQNLSPWELEVQSFLVTHTHILIRLSKVKTWRTRNVCFA